MAVLKFKELPEIEHLNLRIGMHEGEILLMENDVIGDDVNIAHELKHFQHLAESQFQIR